MRIKIHNENPNDNKRTSESGGLVTGVMEIQQTQLWVGGEAWRGLRLLFVLCLDRPQVPHVVRFRFN